MKRQKNKHLFAIFLLVLGIVLFATTTTDILVGVAHGINHYFPSPFSSWIANSNTFPLFMILSGIVCLGIGLWLIKDEKNH